MHTNDERLALLRAFYTQGGANDRGYTLIQLWERPDQWLERSHMFIQWMFPLTTPSAANIYAPLLNDETIQFLREDIKAQENLERSFERFCGLLGLALERNCSVLQVVKGENFEVRKGDWFTFNSHSNARITRVLSCMRLLKRDDLAQVLFEGVLKLMDTEPDCGIGSVAVTHWKKARGLSW
ncbi:MAG: Opioid growth factor receptor (OGFr) conserved region [Idiomarinaceae bacterium HL-53]|nr:MAG: Opioid growth factor receptor (OGFr) conserved region [Idiomarinaceae bacterium HL-53]CUS48005.1 Opioid growth factor receptor (OGFr) conserved region [Idiomarinaceae bacterium HL-53]